MDVSEQELRNDTDRVIAAAESGRQIVLTVRGRPVADIVPRRLRSERRPTAILLEDLAAIAEESRRLDVAPDLADYETGPSSDDL